MTPTARLRPSLAALALAALTVAGPAAAAPTSDGEGSPSAAAARVVAALPAFRPQKLSLRLPAHPDASAMASGLAAPPAALGEPAAVDAVVFREPGSGKVPVVRGLGRTARSTPYETFAELLAAYLDADPARIQALYAPESRPSIAETFADPVDVERFRAAATSIREATMKLGFAIDGGFVIFAAIRNADGEDLQPVYFRKVGEEWLAVAYKPTSSLVFDTADYLATHPVDDLIDAGPAGR